MTFGRGFSFLPEFRGLFVVSLASGLVSRLTDTDAEDWDCIPIVVEPVFSLHAVSLDGSRQVTLVQDSDYSYFAPRRISGRPTAIRLSSWGQIKLGNRLAGG